MPTSPHNIIQIPGVGKVDISAKAMQIMPREERESFFRMLDELGNRQRRSAISDSFKHYCFEIMPGFMCPEHIEQMIIALERVESGKCKRLIIEMPPRHGKTLTGSILFPSWYLGRNPASEVIFTTYSQELANDRGRSCRALFSHEMHKLAFPKARLRSDSAAANRFQTVDGSAYFAVGVGGPITGRGGNLLIIDDPIKNREEADSESMRKKLVDWYQSTLRTRLHPGGAIIIIATRWHLDDLTGHVLEQAPDDWEVLNFPAILDAPAAKTLGKKAGEALWEERYNLSELKQIKFDVGPREWNSLYQQNPVPDDGNIILRSTCMEWQGEAPPPCNMVLASWDTAYGGMNGRGDFSAYTVWGQFMHETYPLGRDSEAVLLPSAILLGAGRGRWTFPQLKEKIIEVAEKHHVDFTVVEARANGLPVLQELRTMGLAMREYIPIGAKDARAHAINPLFEQQRVWFPYDKVWCEDVLQQLTQFPSAKYDDYVDSVTQAIKLLRLSGGISTRHDAKYVKRTGGVTGYWRGAS